MYNIYFAITRNLRMSKTYVVIHTMSALVDQASSAHRIYLLDHQVIIGTLPFLPLWTTVQNLKALNSFIYLCMCAHVCALACAHTHRHMFACVWKSEYGYQELLLSFHYKESVHPMFPCGKNSLNVPFLIEPFIIFFWQK